MRDRSELMQTSRGYWRSRALLTGVELGVFEALGRRRLTARTVAKRVAAEERSTEMLLDALTGMGALTKTGTAYGIARAMLPFLTAGEASALPMLRHHARLWTAWDQLTDSVRTGRPVTTREGFRGDADQAQAFTQAMRTGAEQIAPKVAEEVSFRGRHRLLDLGGGPGVYAAAFARRHPRLEVVVVDLPDVCRVGAAIVAELSDVEDRIRYHAADLDRDPLPEGADAAFLSHVIHSQSPDQVQALFRRVHAALEPGGVLVVREFFTAPDRAQPPEASLFSLNMLVNTEGGRAYSAEETVAWARASGFRSAAYRRSRSLPDTGYVRARV